MDVRGNKSRTIADDVRKRTCSCYLRRDTKVIDQAPRPQRALSATSYRTHFEGSTSVTTLQRNRTIIRKIGLIRPCEAFHSQSLQE